MPRTEGIVTGSFSRLDADMLGATAPSELIVEPVEDKSLPDCEAVRKACAVPS